MMNVRDIKPSQKTGVTILNESLKSRGRKMLNAAPKVEQNDVQILTMKNSAIISQPKQKKMDHYVMTAIKNESDEANDISFILTDEPNQDGNVTHEEIAEELILSDEEKNEVEEIIEHVCGKCFKSFRRIKGLKKHLDFCRIDSGYHLRKEEMLKNLDKIERDALTMENKDVCFCCAESYDTYHLGHINCPDCPKSFKTQLSYERHIFITHSEHDDFPCSVCNAKLRSRKLLQLHEEQHKNRGKPYACKVCGKEFTRPYHLKRHQKYSTCTADLSTSVSCKVCGKEFFRLDNLRAHLKTHLGTHVAKKTEYTCPICKNCFYSLSTLNIHTRTHTGERPFECDLCDKKFPVLVALKKHRRYHTGEKPYTCSVCNQCFAVKEVLNRHMKRHTGEKPHKCDECGKCFIQATQLRNHSKTHIRPFACDICPLKLKTEKALERHISEHNRRKRSTPKCDICKISFTSTTLLKLHMAEGNHIAPPKLTSKKRKVKPQTYCTICQEDFGSARNLEFHILKTHEQDPEEILNQNYADPPCINEVVVYNHNEAQSSGIVKREKQNEDNIILISSFDGTNLPADNMMSSMQGDITNPTTDGAVVVQEYIVDGETPMDDNRTIFLNNESYTIIPIDTYTTVDTTSAATTAKQKRSSSPQDMKPPVSTNKAPTRLNKGQKSSLRASLVAAINNLDEKPQEDEDNVITETDIRLKENVHKLLDLLVDTEILMKYGWPHTSEEEALCKVIENCGHDLSKDAHNYAELDFGSRIREYVKLLFTVVIPNESIKELLNNYPIDEVIEFVLGNGEEEDDDNDDEDSKMPHVKSKLKA